MTKLRRAECQLARLLVGCAVDRLLSAFRCRSDEWARYQLKIAERYADEALAALARVERIDFVLAEDPIPYALTEEEIRP